MALENRRAKGTRTPKRRATFLADLRRSREITQTAIAEVLRLTQGEVSRLERRSDLQVSTLRRFIEALGGSLELVARFENDQTEVIGLALPLPKARTKRKVR